MTTEMTGAEQEPETGAEAATGAVEPGEQEQAPDGTESRADRRDRRTRTRLVEERDQAAAERDRLRETLTPYVRDAVERLAAEQLDDGSALWLVPDIGPLDFLGEDLAVDAEKVAEHVERLLLHAPALARRRFAGGVDAGQRGASPVTNKWAELLGADKR